MSERAVEISYYPLEEREKIARGLLTNLTEETDWEWDLRYHPDPEGNSNDHINIAYWTIGADSKKRRLQMTMVLGRTPWTMVHNFWFTQDERSYVCREDSFKVVPGFSELGLELDKKAREIKQAQDQEVAARRQRESEIHDAERAQGVRDLLSRLHNQPR